MADYQFREVTLYDMSVTFAENQEPEDQEAFLKGCAGTVQEALFLHESTADLTAGTRTKFVHFLASQEELSGFVSLHRGKEPVAFPEKGQAVISEGLGGSPGHSGGRFGAAPHARHGHPVGDRQRYF